MASSKFKVRGLKLRRVQLSRRKGWRMPANTVNVARPSRWGNPFTLAIARKLHPKEPDKVLARRVVRAYAITVAGYEHFEKWIAPLRGKNLACWCKLDMPCHADVLLKLAANAGPTTHNPQRTTRR